MAPRWRWLVWCIGCDLFYHWPRFGGALMRWAAPAAWFGEGAKLGSEEPWRQFPEAAP